MTSSSVFPATSRYATIPTATFIAADGREIVHLTRRFVPAPETLAVIRQHIVHGGERLDNITAQHLGDPEQFWQIADANLAFNSAELVSEPGRRIDIALPSGVPGLPQL